MATRDKAMPVDVVTKCLCLSVCFNSLYLDLCWCLDLCNYFCVCVCMPVCILVIRISEIYI